MRTIFIGNGWIDEFYFWLARKMPQRLHYWVVIKVWSIASCQWFPNKHPDEITWSMVCKKIEQEQK
jgi:hypothetical protein